MKIFELITPIDTWYNTKDDSYHTERRKKDRDEKENKKTKTMRKYSDPNSKLGQNIDIEV